MNEDYDLLEKTIGYQFKDRQFLLIALTHSSFSNEMIIKRCPNYERQEFLGDAVLEYVSSDYLYKEHPELPEGSLTRLRASLVCEPALAFCARQFGLEGYIRLGKGEEASGGRERDSIVSDVLEALIGGIFLDGGIEEASIFIRRIVLADAEEHIIFFDAKSILQEKVQAVGKKLEYIVVAENGPEHAKEFVVNALVDGKVISSGKGKTKKAAQQQAAYEILRGNKCI